MAVSVLSGAVRRAPTAVLICVVTAVMLCCAGASVASGAQPVEFEDEVNGGDCSPCSFHADGESHITQLATGLKVSTCTNEFFTDINHDGAGEVEWIGIADTAPGCNVSNCVVMNPHWSIHGVEEVAAGLVELDVEYCLRSNWGEEEECHASVEMSEIDPHSYAFEVADICEDARVELNAVSESGEGPEIHHPVDR